MRIVGHIDDPDMKITVLQMNNRVSVKFEFEKKEQTYKLNLDLDGSTLGNLKARFTDTLRTSVLATFRMMSEIETEFYSGEIRNEDFPEII